MVVKELSLVKLFEVRVFRKEFGTKRKTVYTAIISNKGLWTKFVLDKKKKKKTDKPTTNDGKGFI
jgi:hypothetical protein